MAKVLVVEDEWLIAANLEDFLHSAGHEVIGLASSVEDALLLVEHSEFDLALLDIQLIDEKSFPIAERLEILDIPYAFLTSYTDREIPPPFNERKILAKPFESESLLEAINDLSDRPTSALQVEKI